MPRGVNRWGLSALCGVLLALCYPKPGVTALAWFCLSPLLLIWSKETPRQAFASGWIAGAAFHAVLFFWIYQTCRFAGIAAALSVLVWVALAAFLALSWGATAAFGAWAAQALPRPVRPWAWAVVWTAFAAAGAWWTPRVGGDLLAYTQWTSLAFIQLGSVFGPHGLGFLIVLANAALAHAWEEAQSGACQRATVLNCAAAAVLPVVAWAWGSAQLIVSPQGDTARVELLQPNIDQYQKWDQNYESRIWANFNELLALPRAGKPDLIVWPETAVPRRLAEGEPAREISDWAKKLDVAHLAGAVVDGMHGTYNAVLLIGPDGSIKKEYRKRELVPFGEYIPFSNLLGFLKRFFGILNQLGGLEAGAAVQPFFETPLGPAAGSICYEAVFPRWARLDAARGARLIVNVTNDGWYKDTWGPHQHFNANRFRAVENRIAVLRCANTGISGVIDPWGRVTARLELGARGRLDAAVLRDDPFPERSLYARKGDWFGALCLLLAYVLACFAPGLRYRGEA